MMDYDAITLDTNTFFKGGLHLEEGILGQLDQFKNGLTQLIVSEIVLRELHKHMKAKHKEASEKLTSAIKNASKLHVLTKEGSEAVSKIIGGPATEKIVQKRIEDFASRTGLRVIPANKASMEELIRLYFGPLPPFDPAGSKKCEFPDAIALLSLEAWAEKEQKKVLAISADEGWKQYAETSKWIDVQPDLAVALEMLQQISEETQEIVAGIIAKIANDGAPILAGQLSEILADEVSSHDYWVEATASLHYDAEDPEVEFQSFELPDNLNKAEFKIVRITRNNVVFQIPIKIIASARTSFSFGVYDSEDKDYIPVGGTDAETEFNFIAKCLITLSGDLGDPDEDIAVEQVDILGRYTTVDFGHVEPNYDPDE